MDEQITAEHLVAEATKRFKATSDWYLSNDRNLLATDYGRLLFMWEATYNSGEIFRQYDEVTFYRALTDETFIPSVDRIISTRDLDKERVREFCLYPIAFTRSRFPWFQRQYRVILPGGYHFIFQWETDVNMTTGQTIRRTTIGIQGFRERFFFMISPSGALTISPTVDISHEGE